MRFIPVLDREQIEAQRPKKGDTVQTFDNPGVLYVVREAGFRYLICKPVIWEPDGEVWLKASNCRKVTPDELPPTIEPDTSVIDDDKPKQPAERISVLFL